MSDLFGPPTAPIPPEPDTAGPAPHAPHDADAGVPPWGVLQILALAAVALGLFVEEDGISLWDVSEAWSVFAIVCAVAQLAPLLRRTLKWSAARAWLVGVIGAAGLVLYWLLIVLPAIARNTSFAITVGAAAAAGAAWLAPGRHDPRR
jgi:hypothetical protein